MLRLPFWLTLILVATLAVSAGKEDNLEEELLELNEKHFKEYNIDDWFQTTSTLEGEALSEYLDEYYYGRLESDTKIKELEAKIEAIKPIQEELRKLKAKLKELVNEYDKKYNPKTSNGETDSVNKVEVTAYFRTYRDVNTKLVELQKQVQREHDPEKLKQLKARWNNACMGEKASEAWNDFRNQKVKAWAAWNKECIDLHMEIMELDEQIQVKEPNRTTGQIQSQELQQTTGPNDEIQGELKVMKAKLRKLQKKYDRKYKPDPSREAIYSVKKEELEQFFKDYRDVNYRIALLKEHLQGELTPEELKKLEAARQILRQKLSVASDGRSWETKQAWKAFNAQRMEGYVPWEKKCLELQIAIMNIDSQINGAKRAKKGIKVPPKPKATASTVHVALAPGTSHTQANGLKRKDLSKSIQTKRLK